jgi:hypothetical protein
MKEYIFSNTVTVVEETTVKANSYDEAEDIFLSLEGETHEVKRLNGEFWECIQNPDEEENADKYQAITNNNADYFVQGEQDE